MALLTPLSLDDARSVAAFWDLDVSTVAPLAAGSVNSNFRVALGDGRAVFLRIYEEQAIEGAERELALVQALARAGVPTPSPLARRDGALLGAHAGKPVAIFPWIEGEILCQRRVGPPHCHAVGRALAQVHVAPGRSAGRGRFEPSDLEARLDRIEREEPFGAIAHDLRLRLRELVARRDPELPRGVIHGDLFRDNVLWDGFDVRALLDFESASEGVFLFDLAVTLEAWCFTTQFERASISALVKGYDAVRRITDREIDALRTEAALAAVRFAVTRITDYSLRAPPGTPPIRDFRRFVARLEEIDAGALDEVVREKLGV